MSYEKQFSEKQLVQYFQLEDHQGYFSEYDSKDHRQSQRNEINPDIDNFLRTPERKKSQFFNQHQKSEESQKNKNDQSMNQKVAKHSLKESPQLQRKQSQRSQRIEVLQKDTDYFLQSLLKGLPLTNKIQKTKQKSNNDILNACFIMEEMIKGIAEEMNFHKKEVQILKSEKDTLQSVLSMKTQDVKKTLTNELQRIDEEMKRHFAHQKAENARLQQQITSLKGEKTALQQQLLGLQRRITELELQVGNEEAR